LLLAILRPTAKAGKAVGYDSNTFKDRLVEAMRRMPAPQRLMGLAPIDPS
jgi:hypothetical protein